MPSQRSLQIINGLGFILVLVANGLANGLPLNGYTTGQLSALYPNLLVPAGFSFIIWGLIYFFLLGFVIFQAEGLFSSKKAPEIVKLTGGWFFLSCMANGAWIFSWHYRLPGLAMLLMLFLLFCLIQVYRNLGPGVRSSDIWEKTWVHVPFSLYLGWISVATLVNATALLVHWGWKGGGLPEEIWAAGMIIVAGLLALLFLHRVYDWVYAMVIIWACYGIYHRHQFLMEEQGSSLVITTTAAVAVLLLYRIGRLRLSQSGPQIYR